jgi:NADH dehydrogenase [ubiquinone] 1 alpha subcomplex assembly factor 7
VIERSGRALRELRGLSAVEVAPRIPADPHVVLGHELLDNLPFRLLRGGSEILVSVAGERFVEVQAPLADAPAGAPHHHGEDGEERTVPTGALALIDELARVLDRGYALFVDYGSERGVVGPVHGYRDHRMVEDVLAGPGTADITAGVDFGTLAAAAVERGLQAFPTLAQSGALAALGFREWMHEELATQGALLNEGRGMDAVQRWAGRSRASILVSPDRLGRLRWFLLASKGLPPPPFMAGG